MKQPCRSHASLRKDSATQGALRGLRPVTAVLGTRDSHLAPFEPSETARGVAAAKPQLSQARDLDLHLAVVVKTVLGSHFGVGAPPILEPILVGIGTLTGGTIGSLTHGHLLKHPGE